MSSTAPISFLLAGVALVGVLLATLMQLAARTVPGTHFLLAFVGFAVLLGCGALWLVALAFVVAARRAAIRRGAPLLLAAALIGGAGLLPVWDPPLQRLGFALARPALDGYLIDGACPDRVGPYRVGSCLEYEDGTRFVLIKGAGLLDGAGYAFSPPGEGQSRETEGNPLAPGPELGGGWRLAVLPWD